VCSCSTQVCGISWNVGTIRAVFYRDCQPLVKPVRNNMKVGREKLKWQNGSEIFKVPCFAKHLTLIIIFPWCVACTVAWCRVLHVCETSCQLPEEFSSLWICKFITSQPLSPSFHCSCMIYLVLQGITFARFTSDNHCSCYSFTVVNLMPYITFMFLTQSSSRKTGACAFRLL